MSLFAETEFFPTTFKTVSEFRRDRAAQSQANGGPTSSNEANARRTEPSMPVPPQPPVPPSMPYAAAAQKATIQQTFDTYFDGQKPAGSQISQGNYTQFDVPAQDYRQFDVQSRDYTQFDAQPQTQATSVAVEQALQYFDAQSRVTAPSTAPTSFVHDNTAADSSALTEFMSKAVDMESAFQFAGEAFPQPMEPFAIPANIRAELLEDDGFVRPMSAEECFDGQELPMPDEPSLASVQLMEQQPSILEQASLLDQAAVLRDPQEDSSITQAVERDNYGRVSKALFCGGESVRFHYDDAGNLVEFNYAGMQWAKDDNGWTAQDRQTEYFVDGTISVLTTGSIRIEREDVVRILKQSGTRVDEHKSGSRTESRKLKNKPSPYDLLAKAKAANSIWLAAKPSNKNSGGQPVHSPFKLDLVVDDLSEAPTQASNSMIPSIARVPGPAVVHPIPTNLACIPTAPIELRSLERTDKLRSLEDELLEPERQQFSKSDIRHQSKEYWLKCNLWITDRLFGQSSPKHLEKLDHLANLYFQQQKFDVAELTYLRALHIREQFYGKGQPELSENVRGLARIYESRGNYARAEELYKEAIQLQENGLRKTLFLYSENVIGNAKLNEKLDILFATIADLSRLYSLQGKKKLCTVVYEKALALSEEISQREPKAEQALNGSAASHLQTMEQLSISDLLT